MSTEITHSRTVKRLALGASGEGTTAPSGT